MKRALKAAGAGALFALAVFAAETWSAVQQGVVGVKTADADKIYGALFAAVQPALPSLLSRIVVAYLLGGAAFGLAAWFLSRPLSWSLRPIRPSPRPSGEGEGSSHPALDWSLVAADFVALVVIACWRVAILRPALFDDVAWLLPAVRWLVDHGEPWHPLVALAAVLIVHAGALAARVARRGIEVRPLAPFDFAGLRFAVPLRSGQRLRLRGSALRPATLRALFATAAAAIVIASGALYATAHARAQKQPLVLLFGIDAFRADRVGTGIAPNVDAFVAQSTLFQNAYTPLAQTEPAWRALTTARWPNVAGSRYPLTPREYWPELPTFPKALADAGWRTTFEIDCSRFNWLGPESGFATRREPPRGAINFALEKMRFRGLGIVADNAAGAWLLPEMVENRALAGLYDPLAYAHRMAARIDADAPTLFAFHSTAAHFPGDPVYPFYRREVSPSAPLARRLRMYFTPIAQGDATAASGWTRADSEALYDELLGQADAQLGIVLDDLKARGLYDDALIIVFSDHGESFHSDHEQLSGATPVHGARLSEEENRLLFAVKLPGQREARRVDELVRLIDVGPTILDFAQRPALPNADGVSLMPLLKGGPWAPQRLFAETGYTHASPAAFDKEHLALAPRTFAAYRVLQTGVVEMTSEAHAAILREKDFGAYDGRSWLVRSPRSDGSMSERCIGPCDDPELKEWLDERLR